MTWTMPGDGSIPYSATPCSAQLAGQRELTSPAASCNDDGQPAPGRHQWSIVANVGRGRDR
jgi:hypothetical protein